MRRASSAIPVTGAETFKKGIVHEPINLTECTACHQPHAASEKGLVPKSIKSSCLKCHNALQEKNKYALVLQEQYKHTHQPYLEGKCGACHQPHNSDRPMLLLNAPDELCGTCHEAQELQAKHANYPGSLRDCLTCHNPHAQRAGGLDPSSPEGCISFVNTIETYQYLAS